jgi:hypothetical protein
LKRNLEAEWERGVIDRVALIINIFAARAQTRCFFLFSPPLPQLTHSDSQKLFIQ